MSLGITVFLAEFNQASPEQLTTLLKNCVHIPTWAEKIISERPYSTKASLLEYAENLSQMWSCLLYTSPSPRDRTRSRMPSSA